MKNTAGKTYSVLAHIKHFIWQGRNLFHGPKLQPPQSTVVFVCPSVSSSLEILIMSSSEGSRAKARSRAADMKPRLLLKYLPLNSGYSQYFAQLAMLKWTIVKTCCRISTFIQWHNLLHKAQAILSIYLETVTFRSFLKPQNQ